MKGQINNKKINTKMKPDPPKAYQLKGNTSFSANSSSQNSKSYKKFTMFDSKQKKREEEKSNHIEFSFLNNLFLHIENNKNEEQKNLKKSRGKNSNFLIVDNDKQEIPYCLSEPNFASKQTILFNPKINDNTADLKKKGSRIKNLQFTKRNSQSLFKYESQNKLVAGEANQTFGVVNNYKEKIDRLPFPSKQSSIELLNIILNQSKQKGPRIQKNMTNKISERPSIEDSIETSQKLRKKNLGQIMQSYLDNHSNPIDSPSQQANKACHICGSKFGVNKKDLIVKLGNSIQKLLSEMKQIYKKIQNQLMAQKNEIGANISQILNAIQENICSQRNFSKERWIQKTPAGQIERGVDYSRVKKISGKQMNMQSQYEIQSSIQRGLQNLIEENNQINGQQKQKQRKNNNRQRLKILIQDQKPSQIKANIRRANQYSPRSVGKIVKNFRFSQSICNFNIPEVPPLKINQLEQRKSLKSFNSDIEYKSVTSCIKKNLARQKGKRKNSEVFYPLTQRNERKENLNMYEKRKFQNCYENMLLALANLKQSCNQNPFSSSVF